MTDTPMPAWWTENAPAWIDIVRSQKVPSRRLGTDAAILNAAKALQPKSVLDMGCGEGWLCRALADDPARQRIGIDVSAPLIEAAQTADPAGRYCVAPFAGLLGADSPVAPASVDLVLMNFVLLEEDAETALKAAKRLRAPGGSILIQMPHPCFTAGPEGYQDGPRLERFAAFEATDPSQGSPAPALTPMTWRFRSLNSWAALFARCGLRLTRLEDVAHPEGGAPLSALFHLT
ncbi:MAG: class I SAM-dependent methyltransferase [Rhodospirillaceae bacterium]